MSQIEQILKEFPFVWAVHKEWHPNNSLHVRRLTSEEFARQSTSPEHEWWVHASKEQDGKTYEAVVFVKEQYPSLQELIEKACPEGMSVRHLVSYYGSMEAIRTIYTVWVLP